MTPILPKLDYCRMLLVVLILWPLTSQEANAQFPLYDPTNSDNWHLNPIASDEFNGSQLDTSKWHIQGTNDFYFSNFIGRAPSQFSTDNVRVENGHLKIETRWDPDFDFSTQTGQGGFDYENITTAAIISKRQVGHGYMEIRAKAADTSVASSFWMLGNNAELDVYEFVGRPSLPNLEHIESDLWSSIHDWSPGAGGVSTWTDHLQLPFKAADDFHVYGIEWNEDYLNFHADGQLVRTVSRAQIGEAAWAIRNPMRMWIDSEVFHWRGLPAEADLPKDYEVDYVRVWHNSPTPNPSRAVFEDDFSEATVDLVWNTGDGFELDAANENVIFGNDTGNWTAQGENAGLLNSPVGYATFSVAADGTNPVVGNFNVGNTTFADTANALSRINLALEGAGTYELIWNNSGTDLDFEMLSGWSGTVGGNRYVWIVDGDTADARWGLTDAAPQVALGDAATTFGFWSLNSAGRAVIDDFAIYETVTPTAQTSDFDGDGGIDGADFLRWQRDAGSAEGLVTWQSSYGGESSLAAATAASVPEPASLISLGIGMLLVASKFRVVIPLSS